MIVLLSSCLAICCGLQTDETKNTKVGTDIEAKVAARASPDEDLSRVKELLAAKKLTADEVMASPAWSHLREMPRFRRAIREAAREGRAVVVPSDEPGTPLIVRGTVRNANGSPIAGALVYVFQTSDNGSYSTRGGNAADMGDSLNPRLFGYVRTDSDGKYEYRTIRPGQYPNDGPPAHIHYEITAEGFDKRVTELMFEDDIRMTPGTKKWATEAGFVIATPERGEDGVWRVAADWTLDE